MFFSGGYNLWQAACAVLLALCLHQTGWLGTGVPSASQTSTFHSSCRTTDERNLLQGMDARLARLEEGIEGLQQVLASLVDEKRASRGPLVLDVACDAQQGNNTGVIGLDVQADEFPPTPLGRHEIVGENYTHGGKAVLPVHFEDNENQDSIGPPDTSTPTTVVIYMVRGLEEYNKKNYREAISNFQTAAHVQPTIPNVWNNMGFCYALIGEFDASIESYKRALEIEPDSKEAWVNLGGSLKEVVEIEKATEALMKGISIGNPDKTTQTGFITYAQMQMQLGNHKGAIETVDRVLAMNFTKSPEFFYLRGSARHGLGLYLEAVQDYQACFGLNATDLSEDERNGQFMALYQMAIAVFMFNNQDRAVDSYCLDKEIPPILKEAWGRRNPPSEELLNSYHPVIKPFVPMQPFRMADPLEVDQVLSVTDYVGSLIHVHHQGFISNVRLQRGAGLGALEIAQTVKEVVLAHKEGRKYWVQSAGASGGQAGTTYHEFGWRDAMDTVVKWRQAAEPRDQVLWIDLMTPKEFEEGFASHTKMYHGQTKHVRYFMNFESAKNLWKKVILENGTVLLEEERLWINSTAGIEAVHSAATPRDMREAIGLDHTVVVPIGSTREQGHTLNGTRLAVKKVGDHPDGYDVSIHTPVTPPRWEDFDLEFRSVWSRMIDAMARDNRRETAHWIAAFAYYWFNFMPLVRGTAMTGHTGVLGLFWAAGMPLNVPLPRSYCPDWDAILTQDPAKFIESFGSRIFHDEIGGGLGSQPQGRKWTDAERDPLSFPNAKSLFPTIRARLHVLSGAFESNGAQLIKEGTRQRG